MNYPDGDDDEVRRRERYFYAIVATIVGITAIFLYMAINGYFMHGD